MSASDKLIVFEGGPKDGVYIEDTLGPDILQINFQVDPDEKIEEFPKNQLSTGMAIYKFDRTKIVIPWIRTFVYEKTVVFPPVT